MATKKKTATAASRQDHHFAVIVGTGFSGLCMAIKLKEAGIHDFVLLERSDAVGGTWRDNHYPGAACDVPSHLYSLSFEPKSDWSRAFAEQPEIRAYLNHCADKYGVRPHIRFNRTVTSAHFDDAEGLWRLTDNHGNHLTANVVVAGIGALSNPAIPKLKGIENFQGAAFHSAQWRHDVDLTGKRVAVIGTGASAIQFVPAIQPKVGKLTLFQRTAPWVLPKPDRAFSRYEKLLFEKVPAVRELYRGAIYTQFESRAIGFTVNPKLMTLAKHMGTAYIRKCVKNPELRAKVTPDYMPGCKRILMSNDYYPALAQANVDVLTTGVREVKANSIVTSDGREVDVDVIIYGTGFAVHDYVGGMDIKGVGGRDINKLWQDGAEAYLGTAVSGFPNLLMLMGPNTGLGHNSMVYMIESQVRYAMQYVQHLRMRKLAYLDVRPEIQQRYNDKLQARLKKSVWQSGCQSWYLNESGKNSTAWPGFTFEFRARTLWLNLNDYVQVPALPPKPAPVPTPALEPLPA